MLFHITRIGSIQFVLTGAIQMTTEIPVKATEFDQRVAIVRWLNLDYQQIDSDKLQGVIRNPFAFYFPIQRGFSGSVQTLAISTN